MKKLTIVIKLGTSSIVHEKTHIPLLKNLSIIAETAVKLRTDGHRVVIVSSGAIGVALRRMNLEQRPKHLPEVQALAALGQCRLMRLWVDLFDNLDQAVAQVLLTRHDIADRTQYLNAQNTFVELLRMNVIPIVNENDTISVSEIKFGDNDTLSAITAGMVQADYLFLMTDVDCLYDKNPRIHADAKAIEVVDDISALVADVSSAGSRVGTGGMATKITAARLATSKGVTTVITRSSGAEKIPDIVRHAEAYRLAKVENNPKLVSEEVGQVAPSPPLHTRFLPASNPIRDRMFWILHGLKPSIDSVVYIDKGAFRALTNHSGLLPAGVVDATGSFGQQEVVSLRLVAGKVASKRLSATPSQCSLQEIADLDISSPEMGPLSTSAVVEKAADSLASAKEIGRAIVTYSASEIRRIKGLQSTEIANVLGYADTEYIAWRENIALFSDIKDVGQVGNGV